MIAISLKNGWARFARVGLDGKTPALKQVGEISLPAFLEDPDFRSERLAARLGELFEKIHASVDGRDKDVYVSLGEDWVASDILEVDSGLNKQELESYLNWVFRQKLGSLWDNSAPFFSILPDGRGNVDTVLVSGVALPLIDALQGAVRKLGAMPVWMEAGILSMDRVSASLDEGRTTRTLAIEPAGNLYRGLFHERGQLRSIALISLRGSVARETVIKGDRALVTGCLEELNAYLAGRDLSPDLQMFLSGEVSQHMMKTLTRSGKGPGVLTIIDPFEGMGTDGVTVPDSSNGSWFVDVRGLIEKGITSA